MTGGEHDAPQVSGLNQPGMPPRRRTRVRYAGVPPRCAENEARKHAVAPPQFGAVMRGLVRHLTASVAEVELTEAEWRAAIATLTTTGHITDDRREQFIL